MKRIAAIFLILSFHVLKAQDRSNVHLLDHWTTDTLLSAQGIIFNEVWYFNRNNRDYAILGSTEGTHFFEITTNDRFRFIGFIRGDFRSAQVQNRDFRDYGNYVYAVADQGTQSALQIINIAQLPDTVFLEKTDAVNWNRAHTICIDTASALLYACSFRPPIDHIVWNYSPLKVFSLANPLEPALVFSGLNNIDEVHYAYVRGDTAYLNCGFDGLRIYNFSNPHNPQLIGTLSIYNDQGYNHSGWLSEDGKIYYFTDESEGKRIKKLDVSNISNPAITNIFGTANYASSIAHHCIPVGDLLFVAYYNEGLRIFDTRTPIQEIAHFDTYPLNSLFKMNGAWGVMPFRKGERILVSDRTFGLFLFGFDYRVFSISSSDETVQIFPNPVGNGFPVSIKLNEDVTGLEIKVYDALGKLVFEQTYEYQTYATVIPQWAQGVYRLSITYKNYLGNYEYKSATLLVK